MTYDTWHGTPDTWHLTRDKWHVTRDTWHLPCDTWWGVNILSKCQLPSSYGLVVMMFWRFGGKGLLDIVQKGGGVQNESKSVGASQWRVCYQRGICRRVFIFWVFFCEINSLLALPWDVWSRYFGFWPKFHVIQVKEKIFAFKLNNFFLLQFAEFNLKALCNSQSSLKRCLTQKLAGSATHRYFGAFIVKIIETLFYNLL